jgi:hypothetical protein
MRADATFTNWLAPPTHESQRRAFRNHVPENYFNPPTDTETEHSEILIKMIYLHYIIKRNSWLEWLIDVVNLAATQEIYMQTMVSDLINDQLGGFRIWDCQSFSYEMRHMF